MTVPIKSPTIEMLLKFLSTGEAVCEDFENLLSVGKAASIFGIANSDEVIVDNKKDEIPSVSVMWKTSDEDIFDIKQLRGPNRS